MNVKNTTMIWKRLNFIAQKTRSNKTAGMRQLIASLYHTLRIVKKKELEFNEELSKHNRIIYQGKIIPLDKLSIDERMAIVDEIITSIENDISSHENITTIKNDRSKYASKLKGLLKKENEPDDLKTLINTVLNSSGHIDIAVIDGLEDMGLKRVNDKRSALTKFIDLHNQVVGAENNSLHKNKTVIQESFFKFPTKNNINEVKPDHYLSIIYNFHRTNLPDYKIMTCVFHGDETLSKKGLNNGVHPHIFINGKNSKTGQYDLMNAQLELVNQHLRNTNRPELKNNSFKSAQKIGEVYQELVYQYVNKKLKEYGYLIEATVSEKTLEHKEKLAKIRLEQNKAKISRSHNLLSFTEEEIERAEAEKKKLELENKRKAEELELKKKQFNSVIKRMNERNDQFKKLEADINLNNGILANTNKEIIKQSKIKDNLIESNKSLNDEQTRLKSIIKNDNKELNVLKNRIASKQKELDNQIEQNDKLKQSNKSLLKQIQENEIKKQKVEDYDLKLNLLSFNIHDRRKIESSLKEFNKANYALLKEMNPKERDEFLMGQKERFRRESIDTVVDTSLSTTQKVGLFFNDVKRRIIKPGS
ncbi:hypothetical protein GXB82_06105 [Pseudomonas stutzeri]|nr:hypothetical protein [Stutzerimonas stutzeri]